MWCIYIHQTLLVFICEKSCFPSETKINKIKNILSFSLRKEREKRVCGGEGERGCFCFFRGIFFFLNFKNLFFFDFFYFIKLEDVWFFVGFLIYWYWWKNKSYLSLIWCGFFLGWVFLIDFCVFMVEKSVFFNPRISICSSAFWNFDLIMFEGAWFDVGFFWGDFFLIDFGGFFF